MKRTVKKIISAILAMILSFSLLTISASADNSFSSNSATGIFLTSATVPQEAIDYAINNIARFLDSNELTQSIDLSGATMGSPFTIQKESVSNPDIYYFPVFQNNKIIYTFRVYQEEGGYSGILSPYLADQLNTCLSSTSETSPLRLYLDMGNVMGEINGESSIWDPVHGVYSPSVNTYSVDQNELHVTDISQNIDFVATPAESRATLSDPAWCRLYLDTKETQGSTPWCAAYVTAAILRFKTGDNSITARSIMEYYHPTNPEGYSLSNDEAVQYSRNKGLSKTTYVNYALTHSVVVSEILAACPIFANCKGSGAIYGTRHALAVLGYDDNNDVYYVRNPWYTYDETIAQNTRGYWTENGYYYWDLTIYKFRA